MKAILAVFLMAVSAPALAGWPVPELGLTYLSIHYGNTQSADNVLRSDALKLPGGPAQILTLNQVGSQSVAGAKLALTLRCDLVRYLAAELNYASIGGGGADSSILDGNTLDFVGTDIQRSGATGKTSGVVPFVGHVAMDTRTYGLALLGYYPLWRGLNVTGRIAMQYVRTDVATNMDFDNQCGGCGAGFSHRNARYVPMTGMGLAYRFKDFGQLTLEYQQTLGNIGDSGTGRYSINSLNVGLSVLVSQIFKGN